MKRELRWFLAASVALTALTAAQGANPTDQGREYHIQAERLADALRAVGRISETEVIFPSDLVEGKTAPALDGRFSAREAVERLLSGSGLTADMHGGSVLIRGRSSPASPPAILPHDTEILVTGSRIAGAPSPSPTTIITQRQMLDAGQNSLADAVRALPQASGAGQNPGIGQNVPEGLGSNLGGGSSINLRGLGSDATLTLLNGHRLSFNSAFQAVDISSIPLAAVDRMEIVTDGASALYGSDAVAGVANIILKRDYQGVDTSARWGASTDGGNRQQQYDLVAGTTWASGGFIATYDFERDTPILASQRSYAADRSPGLTLYPSLRHHSATLSAHQDLASRLSFQVDGLFNERWTNRAYALSAAGDYRVQGNRTAYRSRSFTVAPSLTYRLSDAWTFSLSGVVGRDQSFFNSADYQDGIVTGRTIACYCNRNAGVEFVAQGTLLELPGGPAKLAIGGGIRKNELHSYDRIAASPQDINASQQDHYGFAELSLPLIAPDNQIPLIRRLTLSAATRYEDYRRIDTVMTPKIGAIYSPSPDVDLKASWGKSFKAPTLYQLYSARGASVYDIAVFGGSGYPAGTTGLYSGGGNPHLKPERATSLTATLSLHPRPIPGLTIDATYFTINYRDRIVTPVTYITQALSNPIYADLVNMHPTGADIDAAIDGALFFNNSSGPFDPSKVGAIIYSQYANATHQHIDGADVEAQYRIEHRSLGTITLTANGSYIRSHQTLSPLQPEMALAGTLFNPPHFRVRSGFVWEKGRLTVSPFLDYIGGVEDQGATPPYHVGSMTTFDLTLRRRLDGGARLLKGAVLSLTAQNIFNAKPAPIVTTQVSQSPYDSANYSPWGRFVSVSISKSW